jgi:hypothetical protein
MPEKSSKGKMVRLKTSAVRFIEEQSEVLNKPFLETLYYILNIYERDYVIQNQRLASQDNKESTESKEQIEESKGLLDGLSLDDFETE